MGSFNNSTDSYIFLNAFPRFGIRFLTSPILFTITLANSLTSKSGLLYTRYKLYDNVNILFNTVITNFISLNPFFINNPSIIYLKFRFENGNGLNSFPAIVSKNLWSKFSIFPIYFLYGIKLSHVFMNANTTSLFFIVVYFSSNSFRLASSTKFKFHS